MKIVSKEEMADYPRGTVFAEHHDHVGLELEKINIKDDYEHGATSLCPDEFGELFDWDWNLNEYRDSDTFWIFERQDVDNMIKLLLSGFYYDIYRR